MFWPPDWYAGLLWDPENNYEPGECEPGVAPLTGGVHPSAKITARIYPFGLWEPRTTEIWKTLAFRLIYRPAGTRPGYASRGDHPCG